MWLSVPDDPFDENEIRGKMLNAIVVANGYARAAKYEPNVLYYDILSRLQEEARAEGRGVSYFF